MGPALTTWDYWAEHGDARQKKIGLKKQAEQRKRYAEQERKDAEARARRAREAQASGGGGGGGGGREPL